jgi:hypothetical protein
LRPAPLVRTGLDFAEFGQEDTAGGGDMRGDGFALRLGTDRLLAGRDPDIGDETRLAGRTTRAGMRGSAAQGFLRGF